MSAAINGSFNLADVRDLAAGTIAAADRGRQGECYILGNDAVSFKDFSRIVSEESGCKNDMNPESYCLTFGVHISVSSRVSCLKMYAGF